MPAPERDTVRPVRDGLAIAVATGLVGVVFGVLASAEGLSTAKTCAMSLLVFTGATQFAAVSIVGTGGSVLAAVGTGVLLASRNALYGPLVARWFRRWPLGGKVGLVQIVIDESTGVGASQPDSSEIDTPAARRGFLAAGIGIYLCWNVGTLIGVLGGSALGRPEDLGLDAAFPAAFLALLVPHVRTQPGRAAALFGAGIALVAIPVLPTGLPILVAGLGAIPAARWWADERPGP